jgi:hypothetical protein
VRRQRVLGQGPQAGEHTLGIQHRARSARVDAGVGERKRCTVESQEPSTVMTAGVVGRLDTDGERQGAGGKAAHRRPLRSGLIPREVPVRPRLRPAHRRSSRDTSPGMTGPCYGFLFSIPGQSERLRQMQRGLVQRQAMHGSPQV